VKFRKLSESDERGAIKAGRDKAALGKPKNNSRRMRKKNERSFPRQVGREPCATRAWSSGNEKTVLEETEGTRRVKLFGGHGVTKGIDEKRRHGKSTIGKKDPSSYRSMGMPFTGESINPILPKNSNSAARESFDKVGGLREQPKRKNGVEGKRPIAILEGKAPAEIRKKKRGVAT